VKHRIVNATEFKAKCLALLDEVAEDGGTITIIKRGCPVATLGPPKKRAWKSSENILAGKMKVTGDIINTHAADLWDVLRHHEQRD